MIPRFNIHVIFLTLTCLLTILFSPTFSWSQDNKRSKKVEIPKPERVLLETKDQVELRAEWFAGTNEKESVPIILVHDWDSDRRALTPLAEVLQKKGHAVIVPDLRGHGESLTVKGMDKELDRSRFKKNEIASVVEDIDVCRRFLQEQNNEGKLNLDMLTVVACGKMSIPAVHWCISDWKWPPIAGVKQGQNVKALILISPYKRFKSLSLTQSLKAPLFSGSNAALPTVVVYGQDHDSTAKDGKSIFELMKKSRREPEEFASADERWQKQSLFRIYYNSNLESEELLAENGRELSNAISVVIDKKIIANQTLLPWQSREIK